ncbi:unnamed protein product [Bemisia tabaci]|uniref:furin n=1 Tax=Bemisia tabaci TaxID=7038 RepID=A0A9P0F6B1_BEMTA|nr:unnamed protein product [Bemisia tabaci]
MATVDLSLWLLLLIYICVQVSYSLEYTSQWAASIEGGPEKAAEIAMKHDFVILGQIFDDVYHLKHSRIAKRSTRPSHEHHKKLTSEAGVTWAQQQIAKHRMKRDYLKTRSISGISVGRKSRNYYLNDPKWPQMWYLNRGNGLDMNVMKAWQEGITGKGVVVTILDDGLEKDHPDLIQNYDPQASYDVNSHDDDPAPRYDQVDSNRHGTRCAGEVAATANNSLCSVGIAFGASVGGVRMLDGDVTDAVEARSLSLNPQHIDIYSASWGPDDDGKTVDGPGDLATRAFMQGVTKGRKGKGSIFIWASGNGGRDHDNCNCDGYTNSIWTLSIGSATENGLVPWYSEACSSTLATTYSSGASHESQIVTTDLRGTCTSNHTGTSASAPLAAGICALALEANMKLTWRDMQHIVVQTARPANLKTADWAVNGVGRNVSHSFGYGLMDAGAMVELARKWQTVPEQHRCDVSMPLTVRTIPAKSYIALQHTVKKCPGVNYLEHVQAKITLNAQRRGDLRISLTSPHGTTSVLLAQRPHDSSRLGFHQWPFMTVHMWGESPIGTWKLEIHNEGRIFGSEILEWNMIFYGTETSPGGTEVSLSDPLKPIILPDVADGSDPDSPEPNNIGFKPGNRFRELAQRNNNQAIPSSQSSASAPKSGCVVTTATCLECGPGYYLYDGKCSVQCPVGTYPITSDSCQKCHYSCRKCSGSNDYECTSCYADATLTNIDEGASYCYPKSLIPSIDATKWYFRACIALAINCFLISMMSCYFLHRSYSFRRFNSLFPSRRKTKIPVHYKAATHEESDSS